MRTYIRRQIVLNVVHQRASRPSWQHRNPTRGTLYALQYVALAGTADAAEQGSQRLAVSALSAQQLRAAEVRAKIGGVDFFFDEMPDSLTSAHGEQAGRHPIPDPHNGFDAVLSRRETIELVRAYHRITDPAVRKSIRALLKSMGAAET